MLSLLQGFDLRFQSSCQLLRLVRNLSRMNVDSIEKDTIRLFPYAEKTAKQFKVVNDQDLWLMRKPRYANIFEVTEKNIHLFIQLQLKVHLIVSPSL